MHGGCVFVTVRREGLLPLMVLRWVRTPGKMVVPRTRPCGHPDLRLAASRTLGNTLLLLISQPVCGVSSRLPSLLFAQKSELPLTLVAGVGQFTAMPTFSTRQAGPWTKHGLGNYNRFRPVVHTILKASKVMKLLKACGE